MINTDSLFESIESGFIDMATFHLIKKDQYLSFEYNKRMSDIYDTISDQALKALDWDNFNKDKKDTLTTILENLPRETGGYNIPISLDLMFRSDGHSFSKLFHIFKKNNHQPFSLEITQAFVNTVLKFADTNEFKGMVCFYLCSDEITGLSRHGEIAKDRENNVYTGSHPFGGKRDKLTSMISATISANFFMEMKKMVNEKILDEVCNQRKSLPTFDARVFPTNKTLVGLMFMSRILSCYRNTVSEFHDYFFGTKAGVGISSVDKKKHMLDVYGFDFDKQCPPCLKYGVFVKGSKVFVPTRIPKNDEQFVNFLYAKELTDNLPYMITLEEMLSTYPSTYIPNEIREEKRIKHEQDMKIREEKRAEKEERSRQYVRPSHEEVIRLRLEKKKQKEAKRQEKLEKVSKNKESINI